MRKMKERWEEKKMEGKDKMTGERKRSRKRTQHPSLLLQITQSMQPH